MAIQGKMNYDQVESLAADLLAQGQKMETHFEYIKNLFKEINSGAGTFDGDAASEIVTNFNNFSNSFVNFSDAVKSCGNFVNNAVASYKAVDSAAQSAVSGLGSGSTGNGGR